MEGIGKSDGLRDLKITENLMFQDGKPDGR